jgi:mediator of RNA polymerase II transcription subunit 14
LVCRVSDSVISPGKVCLSPFPIHPIRIAYTSVHPELQKFGPSARGWLYIQLSNFPSHYLVLVITDDEFRFALISVEVLTETMYTNLIMKDIGWLIVERIHGEDVVVGPAQTEQAEVQSGQKRKREVGGDGKDTGGAR